MTVLVTRAVKGSDLTPTEADTNFKLRAQTKSGNYTVIESDNRDTIEVSAAATITLTAAATILATADTGDFCVTIKNASADDVIVQRSSTDTIDGATSITLFPRESITVKANNGAAGWNVISRVSTAEQSKYKTTDTSRNSTTTLADDPHLAGFVLTPGGVYQISGLLLPVRDSTGATFKCALQVDNAPVYGWARFDSGSDTADGTQQIVVSPTAYAAPTPASTPRGIFISGVVKCHATADSILDLQWAQVSSSAAATILNAGSWITLRRIG